MLRDAIRLDPSARGFASTYVKTVAEKVKIKTFLSD